MLHLKQQGWTCCEKRPNAGGPEVYQAAAGSPKQWWIKPAKPTVSVWYLLALATAESHGKDVPHFKNQSTYRQILGLEEAQVRRRRRSADNGFAIGLVQDASVLPAPKPRRSNPKRSARPGRGAAIPAITSDAADELDSDGRDVVSDEDADPEESSANAEPSASSSGSSSNSGSSGKSSSDSSSSSSGGSASAAEDEDSDAERRPGHGHATQLLATSFFWKGCRFTRSKADGEHIGWECTCRDPKHREGEGIAAACRRSLRFARHGGEEVVLRKLKWWLLQSYDYDTRREHVAECPWVPLLGVDYLPRTEDLDSDNLRCSIESSAAGAKAKVKPKPTPKAAKAKGKSKAKAKSGASSASAVHVPV